MLTFVPFFDSLEWCKSEIRKYAGSLSRICELKRSHYQKVITRHQRFMKQLFTIPSWGISTVTTAMFPGTHISRSHEHGEWDIPTAIPLTFSHEGQPDLVFILIKISIIGEQLSWWLLTENAWHFNEAQMMYSVLVSDTPHAVWCHAAEHKACQVRSHAKDKAVEPWNSWT